jgi:serine/threonine protein kinase
MSLRSSSPDLWQVWLDHPFFDSTRYGRSFQELGLLGKGGYGKVYHVKHTLDKSEYAVKKVPLNASRVARIRERGQAELDILLAEVVALAKMDHPNIVRYYSGWLEYCIPDLLSKPPHRVTRETKLLEGT